MVSMRRGLSPLWALLVLCALAALALGAVGQQQSGEEDFDEEGGAATLVVRVNLVIPQGDAPAKTKPCQAAEVTLEGTEFKATTNAKGIARLVDVPEGEYVLVASLANHAQAKKTITVKGTGKQKVTITLESEAPKEVRNPVFFATEAKTSSLTPNMTGKQQEEIFHVIYSLNAETLDKHKNFAVDSKPFWLCFDASGRKLFTAVEGKKIYVVDITKESEAPKTIGTGDGFVTDLKRIPGRSDVIYASLAASPGAGVMIISTESESIDDFVPVSGSYFGALALGVSADGALAVTTFGTASSSDGEVVAVDLGTKSELGRVKVGGNPLGAAISPDRQFAYVSSFTANAVYMISTRDWKVAKKIAVGSHPMRIALTPDGSKLFVANNGSNDVTVVEARAGTVLTTIAAGTAPMDVACSLDGRRVYVTNKLAGTVTVIDGVNNAAIKTVSLADDINIFGATVCPK